MEGKKILDDVVILAGSGLNSTKIAKGIAKRLAIRYSNLEASTFPDSEIYVRIPVKDVTGKHIIYVQSTAASHAFPQSQSLMELFLTLDTFKEKKAKMVDIIVPYLAHARQDQEFNTGEIISTRTIAKMLKGLGINRLFTVDVHAHRETGAYQFGRWKNFLGVEAYNITAARALARYIKNDLGIQSPIVIIPDEGHRPIAEKIKDILTPETVIFLYKRRISAKLVRFKRVETLNLKGKDVVIFDDMISTGTTVINASKFAMEKGARNVVVAVTHALYINDARKRLLKTGVSEIVATDTIPSKDSRVPIAPIIAGSLKEILD